MKPHGTVEYNSLSWVKQQLDAVLTEAQTSLSEYIETKDDSDLHDCINGLHLAYGTLQMVEVFGAAMLAEEMEQTAKAILDDQIDNIDDVFDVLMRAMLQLPDYLEGLQSGNKDTPMALLPLMNDLRAVRKASLLSENVLFFPDIEAVNVEEQEIEAPVLESGKLYGEAKRLRMHYQLGLLDVLKNNKLKPGCQRMLAVITALEKVTPGQSVRRFWSVIAALLEGMYEGGIDSGVSVKLILGGVDRQLKLLIDIGEDDFAAQYSQELLKNILYYIGHSTTSGPRVSRIKEIYNLDELLTADDDTSAHIGGLNAELFASVSQGIKEDLNQVKDALEIYVHGSDKSTERLSPLVEQLNRIGDTYGMLGLGDSRQKVLEQKETLEDIISSGGEADNEAVFAIAGELLSAEADLDNYIAHKSGMADIIDEDEGSPVHASAYREVLSTVIKQGLENFTDAKEAILSFTSGIGNHEQLTTVVELLEEVRGVTLMLQIPQVENMLTRLTQYVQLALIENKHQPDADEQDTVADVVTAIEYFFESMAEGRPGVEQGLRTGEEAVDKLEKVYSSYESTIAVTEESAATAEDEISLEPEQVELSGEDEKKSETKIVDVSDETVAEEIQEPEPEPEPEPVAEAAPAPTTVETVAHEEFEILGDDVDDEILDIFIEEAVEVLGDLNSNLPAWKANTGDDEALAVVRRSFHTLKGSGRLVGAQLIGEFSWKFENMLNRVIDGKIQTDSRFFETLEEALAVLPQLIEQLRGNREPVPNVYHMMAVADALAEGEEPPAMAAAAESHTEAPAAETAEPAEGLHIEEQAEEAVIDISEQTAENEPYTIDLNEQPEEQAENEIAIESIEPEAAADEFSIESLEDAESMPELQAEGDEVMLSVEEGADEVMLSTEDVPEESAATAEDEISLEPEQVELQVEALTEEALQVEETAIEEAGAGEAETGEAVTEEEIGLAEIDVTEDEVALSDQPVTDEVSLDLGGEFDIQIDESPVDEDTILAAGMDPVLFKIYYDESIGHLNLVQGLLDESSQGSKPLTASNDLVRAFHTLYGSARTAEIDAIAEICGVAEKYVKARQEANDISINDHVAALISEVVEKVRAMLNGIKSGQMPGSDKSLTDRLNKALQSELQNQLQMSSRSGHEASATADEIDIEEMAPAPSATAATEISYGEIDDDLIDIFIEEADELIESCEELLQTITSSPNDEDSIHQLQRYMHTLKGGARMAELTPIGDLTHLLESLVIKVAEKQVDTNKFLFNCLNDSIDRLAVMLKNVKDRAAIESAGDLTANIESLIAGVVPEQRAVERYDLDLDDLSGAEEEQEAETEDIIGLAPEAGLEPEVEAEAEAEEITAAAQPEMPAEEAEPAVEPEEQNYGRRATDTEEKPHWGERATDVNFKESQEQVRVRADLLNTLVNSAGEVNIYHARMGKQMSDIGFNLAELESTVVRLQQQLRNLEIETEIQIRSSFERESEQYDEDFDPLEMDKYSTIQQLSRSLTETASDVESIREILSEIVRDSETLLLQESRVSIELQEGLMRTRMVRFGGLGTRLRRIVRQTSRELGKEVELDILGETNELDRTILDRIVAPLEHMLRNAVAHGIETPEQRQIIGKKETGLITITVDRQGADVLLKVRDDGAGINADNVRAKAIQQGLIEEDSEISDRDVLQFILNSGFSTADKVTQVAGRGVGMDVVDAELKQLGGTLEIDTTLGRGTEFTIRLPLTLAINQALLVNTGEDIYAIPLASIEGVVRVTGAELQRFYDSEQRMYEFNNVEYELKHLGDMLTGQKGDYSQQYGLYPVLLAQVGDKHYALHVDELVGRREIVVKPVGMQISTVRGIAGATILADGRVVLIIEMSALVVGDSLFKEVEAPVIGEVEEAPAQAEERTVMVVDDSITIRKVTARMLERNGINVLLAKDGIDATNQLIENKPDLMLLDIEMPRMDGFELATYIRNDDRLKDLPIIMITSRTGEKHKEKALEIGVNQYLGKPYQEEELMKNINEILEA